MNLKIAELRRKHHLTQKELGDILSVSYQTVSKWENGQVLPDISILPMMSRYFHVSVDAILGLTPLRMSIFHPLRAPPGIGAENFPI